MRRSAAPSVIGKKLQEQGEENVAETKSRIVDRIGENEPRWKVSIGRKKFKSPVASIGLVDPSALKPRAEGGIESSGSEGFAECNDANVVTNSPLAGRNPSQVLKLINSGRVGAEGNKTTSISGNNDNLSPQSTNSLPPSRLDSVPNLAGKSECGGENLDLTFIPGRSSLPESSSPLAVKRSCPEDGELEKENLDSTRKKHQSAMKLEECLLDGKTECVEEAPAISNETIVAGETESKHLNVSHLSLSCTDRDDLNVKSESTSSEMKKEQYVHVKEEVVPLDSKPTNPGTVLLHGPQRQRPPSLHEINSQVASKPCQEVVSAEYSSVMYCSRKPNSERVRGLVASLSVKDGPALLRTWMERLLLRRLFKD